MASITFVDYQTIIPASWLNDVNALVYSGTLPATTLTATNLIVTTSLSGTGVDSLFASPPAIGGTAAAAGTFTTLSASSTVSGAGFSAYLASPPAIGGTAAAAGSFTTLSASSTVSGAGFSTYMASPPAIGGTAAAAGTFTSLTASGQVNMTSTGAVLIPKGTTAQQPTGVAGYLRFNSQTTQFEGYNGSAWASVGGAAISNDTSTGLPVYPLFASATSGTALTVYTSNANLLYTPSIGEFQASQLNASNGIFVNNKTITRDYTVLSNNNAGSFGPITVADGVTVTVSTSSTWSII